MSTNTALTTLSDDIYSLREDFGLRLVDNSIKFDAEAGFAIQQLAKNDFTLKTALGNRQSVWDAVVNVAAIGISLNPAEKLAYLVPRDGRICLDVSYMGLMYLAMQTGSVRWAQAALVYEADSFSLIGLDKAPLHTFNPFAKDRGGIIGVYVTIKTSDGDYLTHTMTAEDAYAIRDRSSAWKAWVAKKANSPGPWGTDEGEMVKKTCVKQACKYWPKVERLDNAIHHLNTVNGEGLEVLAGEPPAKLLPNLKIAAVPDIALSPERAEIIKLVAQAAIDYVNADDAVAAFGEYEGVTDNEEKIALWKMLPSNVRSAIKKHGETLKSAPMAA